MKTDCINCMLCIKRLHILEPLGNTKSSILFIGNYPNTTEDKYNKLLTTRNGKKFLSAIQKYGFTEDLMCYTTLLRCKVTPDINLNISYYYSCYPNFEETLKNGNFKILVPVGQVATDIITGTTGMNIQFAIDKKYFIRNGYLIVPLPNMVSIFKNDNYFNYFETQMETIFNLYKLNVNPFHKKL